MLDRVAEDFNIRYAELDELSPRQRAITLLSHLREQNLVGIHGDARYHDLQNSFIGIALQDDNHQSLPLISVVIFCCVAVRLSIDARPCRFPFHVLAVVNPPPGRNLDGREVESSQASAPMYLDPFRSGQETDVQDLEAQLRSMGVPSVDHSKLLNAASVEDIVRRCAKNIIISVQALPRRNGAGPMSTVSSFPEMDGALYAALWSLVLLPEGDQGEASLQRSRYLHFIVEKVETDYLTDIGIIEDSILPFILDRRQREGLIETIRVVRASDRKPKQLKPRSQDIEDRVQFKVGQAFRHKRYNYQAVITGWDVECEAGEQWMETMNVRSLSRGQYQSFYHVL